MTLFDTTDVNLEGQVTIVTGGGRGIGRAIAQALSAAKAKVAVVARTKTQLAETVDLIEKAGGQVLAIPADIADHDAIVKMVETVQRELGEIDLLVNNAAVVNVPGPIWESDPKDWQHTFDVNLHGAFLCAVTVLKTMVKRQHGRIINVASGAAMGPITYGAAYCVSKAALLRLTECIAEDAKAHGIIAFAIDPGSVHTAMSSYLIESEEGQTYLPWFREFMLNGGAVPAELPASLVTLLASGKVDSLSGCFIGVTDDVDQLVSNSERIAKEELFTLRIHKLS